MHFASPELRQSFQGKLSSRVGHCTDAQRDQGFLKVKARFTTVKHLCFEAVDGFDNVLGQKVYLWGNIRNTGKQLAFRYNAKRQPATILSSGSDRAGEADQEAGRICLFWAS